MLLRPLARGPARLPVKLDEARVAHLREQFAPVLDEIRKLRDLDLTDVHPPVIFDPSLPIAGCPMTEAVWSLPITELSRRIAARELSSVELVSTSLERVRRLDGNLRASCACRPQRSTPHGRPTRRSHAQGPRSPLHGIPIGIKDNYTTADMPTRAGTAVEALTSCRRTAIAWPSCGRLAP